MDRSSKSGWGCWRVIAALAWLGCATAWAAPPRIEVQFSDKLGCATYSGRVYLVITERAGRDPLEAVDWFDPERFYAREVEDWAAGDTLTFDAGHSRGFPDALDDLPAGNYWARAAVDLNGHSWDPIRAPGNAISSVVSFTHDPTDPPLVRMLVRQKLPGLRLVDTRYVKYVELTSDRLSRFHGRDVVQRAAVQVPPEYYTEPDRRFPTLYVIPGFTSTIRDARGYLTIMDSMLQSVQMSVVIVFLDADCATGHHVFADSDNNGPRGTALVRELIPHLEQRFRLIPQAGARYVTGISSGGWSSLWLQVAHADAFGGCWAISPDPVDFRSFMRVNIYEPGANMLRDEVGEPRMLSRAGLFGPPIELEEFARGEVVLGRGGQFYSFDAVFSPRGDDGRPRFMWDRQTGAINREVAEQWKRYDIRQVLTSKWATLEPKLRGKLYLYCGGRDEFYLDEPFALLRDALRELGSDAHIELLPNCGHGLLPPTTMLEIGRQMRAQFAGWSTSRATATQPAGG